MKKSSFARLARAFSSYPTMPDDLFCVRVYNVSSRRKLVNLTFYPHAVAGAPALKSINPEFKSNSGPLNPLIPSLSPALVPFV